MNTETGRIYEPAVTEKAFRDVTRFHDRLEGLEQAEAKAKLMDELGVGEERADAGAAMLAGRVAAVSEQVVQKVRLGERELARRERRRAAKKRAGYTR